MSVPPPSDDEAREAAFTETYHRGRIWRKPAFAAVLVTAAGAYAFLRWRPFRVEVAGGSMAPVLLSGDWALAVARARVRRGAIVVVEHPERPGFELVKRVISVPGDLAPDGRILGGDQFWVQGDAQDASTDSRTFGPVRRELVRAEIRLIYRPSSRRWFRPG